MNTTTFAIELDDQHMDVLNQLCAEQGLSRSQLLRQALRVYQAEHLAQTEQHRPASLARWSQHG